MDNGLVNEHRHGINPMYPHLLLSLTDLAIAVFVKFSRELRRCGTALFYHNGPSTYKSFIGILLRPGSSYDNLHSAHCAVSNVAFVLRENDEIIHFLALTHVAVNSYQRNRVPGTFQIQVCVCTFLLSELVK
jgi:hypothetical protein